MSRAFFKSKSSNWAFRGEFPVSDWTGGELEVNSRYCRDWYTLRLLDTAFYCLNRELSIYYVFSYKHI